MNNTERKVLTDLEKHARAGVGKLHASVTLSECIHVAMGMVSLKSLSAPDWKPGFASAWPAGAMKSEPRTGAAICCTRSRA